MRTRLPTFDGAALITALDARRAERGLDWNRLATEEFLAGPRVDVR